jgi:hypothetical protein
MAKFILIGATDKQSGILVNVEHIKFMHVMKLEEKKHAVQIIFGTNESYVSEGFKTEKKAMEYYDGIMTQLYGLIGPEGMSEDCRLVYCPER